MNYELKSINTMSVFLYTLRIFPIIGFVAGVFIFYVFADPNPAIHGWVRVAAPFVFTIIYTIVISILFSAIAFLYNVWAQNASGIKFHFEQTEE